MEKHLRFGGKTSSNALKGRGKVKFYWIFVCIRLLEREIYINIRIKQIKFNSSTVCFDINLFSKTTIEMNAKKIGSGELFFRFIVDLHMSDLFCLRFLDLTSEKNSQTHDKWVFDKNLCKSKANETNGLLQRIKISSIFMNTSYFIWKKRILFIGIPWYWIWIMWSKLLLYLPDIWPPLTYHMVALNHNYYSYINSGPQYPQSYHIIPTLELWPLLSDISK